MTKEDFLVFKAAAERHNEESEIVKKLYEKWNGCSFPKDRCVKIAFGDRNLFYDNDNKDDYISIKVAEHYCDKNANHCTLSTEGVVIFDDDVKEALLHFGHYLMYRGDADIRKEVLARMYVDHKASCYGINLDNETYKMLRKGVESFI